MAPQKPTQVAPSRQSRRIHYQSAEVAERQRVRKHAKNVKRRDRKKRSLARGEDALHRLQAGDVMCHSCQLTAELHRAAHPHSVRSNQGAAPAARSTCDAATTTDDLDPVIIDVTESEREIRGINEAEAPSVRRSIHRGDTAALRERASSKWARFSDEIWGWVPVVACVALTYAHWRGDFNPRLVGLRG